jgi:hypothetical protein
VGETVGSVEMKMGKWGMEGDEVERRESTEYSRRSARLELDLAIDRSDRRELPIRILL